MKPTFGSASANIQQIGFRPAKYFYFVVSVAWCLSIGLFSPAGKSESVIPVQPTYIAQLNLQSKFVGYDARLLGFNDKGAAILSLVKPNLQNVGNVVQWDIKKEKPISKLAFSKKFSSYFLRVSTDGRWLFSGEDTFDPTVTYNNAHYANVVSSASFNSFRSVDLGVKNGIMGFVAVPNNSQQIIVRMDSLIPYEDTSIYGHNRLEWLNLKTGKIDKKLFYQPANELDKLMYSPDGKYLVSFFYSEAFDPYGTSNYAPLKNSLDREGYVDIISQTTGKILWHIEPSAKKPVGDPFFFISPTQFVSSDTLFDIPTKTAKPWSAVSATRKCLAAVPNHASHALFVTPQGLELRDWRRKRTLRRWPTITKSGHILFSPDLKMFSFKRDSTIQFWKFDPAWLK